MSTYREAQEATTANYGAKQVSGVHEAPTQPAPYVDEAPPESLVGSVPIEALTAHFQPIVALRTGKTFGFEALPQCNVEGLSDPEELFARATFEKTVGELGRAVRAVAFTECVGVPVFIGVHPHELKDSWLIRPDDPICSHDAQVYLQLDQPSYAAMCLHVLTEVASRPGISIVVDDFGAGASSLKQIIDLAPAFVKLDPELVHEIDSNLRKRKAVSAVVRLCAELGAQVIAKGVESPAQLRALTDVGVLYAQGLLLGAAAAQPVVSSARLVTR